MTAEAEARNGPKPVFNGERGEGEQSLIYAFVWGPTALLVLGAIPAAAVGWLSWLDFGLAVGFYVFTCLGVTIGYHRHFTHGAFKAATWLRVILAIAGSMAVQGPVITWVADHRRHHAFADREGDPHSPWLFGTSSGAIAKGFWHAHMGWLFDRKKTNHDRFAPDLVKVPALRVVQKLFWLWMVISFLLPAAIGGLVTGTWWGAATAFFWAGFVRVAVLHHVTWSVNSICHMIGERPFASRDKATNFWPLAIFSMGESWHNSHHADPTCARHGVGKGQLDVSARIIWMLEKLRLVWDVRWPKLERRQLTETEK